ncbi:MAG: glycosyltransferase [Ktedonobacteraceae bacterium]
MKKFLLLLFLYSMLIAMIFCAIRYPGNIGYTNFKYFYIAMLFMGFTWMMKTVFFTLLAPWYTHIWARRKRYFAQRNYKPLVSVIIPAWNEEVGLVSTLKTILASSYRPLEVIVVNDGSTDRSDEFMRAFLQKYQNNLGGLPNYVPVIYHYQPNGGKGVALNTGIVLSHGEIIVTFDADCVVHEDAVKHFVSYFADPEVMAAAGNIRIGNTKTILGFIQGLEYYMGFQTKKAEAVLSIVFVIGGAASAFRREVFAKLGGYHVGALTEDIDISLRIQEAGMRIVYAPEAIVHTEGPTTLRSLLTQRLRWKRGRIEAFSMHKSSFFSRKKGSNKPFFWIILPLIILEDIEFFFGAAYIIMLYVYSIMAHDFSILLLNITLATFLYTIQFTEDKQYRKLSYFLLSPLIWFLFHLVTFVEINAHIKALYTFFLKREVKWQKWQRTGVADS